MENELRALLLSQLTEVELVYKSKAKASARPRIAHSKDCYALFLLLWDPGKIGMVEQFKILFLNRANRVIGFMELSSGGITGTVVDPRVVLAAALKILACGLVLAHNHPSGNLLPSQADEELTQKLKAAAGHFDIKIIDHLILNDEGFYSFSEEGLL
jgi:DNA repair protein RadC